MRCIIVGGADIQNYNSIQRYLKNDDFYIFCDCGLKHVDSLNVKADLIVGDFDSHSKPETDVETIVLPREKDDTDTFFAIKEAIRRGFDEFSELLPVKFQLQTEATSNRRASKSLAHSLPQWKFNISPSRKFVISSIIFSFIKLDFSVVSDIL